MTDDVALERLEALIAEQHPATAPWEPVTDYSYQGRVLAEGKHPDLIKSVLRPEFVLDVGCGPGHLVRMLNERGVKAFGCDKVKHPGATQYDITTEMPFGAPAADVVICREVLEHLTLREIRRAVTNLCALSSRLVYVTTRFARFPDHLLDVRTFDDLDPTHITMLNQDFLRLLFVLEGFRRRADLEAGLDWLQQGRCLVYERVP